MNTDTNIYDLAVIIVNYQTPALVCQCLESLLPELSEMNATAVVVDNYSGDDSVAEIDQWIASNESTSQVQLLQSKFNSGFSGGNNFGILSVNADHYLLLNSDTIVRKGAIGSLLREARSNVKAGLISPRLEWEDGTPQKSCFKFHSPLSELISSARSGPVTKLLKSFEVAQPVSNQLDYYDWTSFACVLIKRDVFKKVGLMDSCYFMYFEDVAFSREARKKGWGVCNVPQSRVVHLRGGSSPVKKNAQLKKRLPRYFYESRARYFYQSYGRMGLLAANLLWTTGWLLSHLRARFSPEYQPSGSERQWADIWINFTDPLTSYTHPISKENEN